METLLSKLKIGDIAKIVNINGDNDFKRKISSMGIQIGKKFKFMSKQPFLGPIVIKIGRTQIAIGRGIAGKIIIRK